MEKKTIPVVGMACAGCSANVEKKLNALEGINVATVNLPGRSVLVEYDPKTISLQEMKDEINAIGYDLVIEEDRSVVEIERRSAVALRRKVIVSWIFALLCMAFGMRWIDTGSSDVANQIMLILAAANIVYCGKHFYVNAYRQLTHGMANMDTLVAMSTGISFAFSVFNTFWGERFWGARGMEWHTYYDASIMIITFVLTGKMLEERAKNGTASAIRALMGLAPKTARLVNGSSEGYTEVPISTISKGDVIEVMPGGKVPVDGIVAEVRGAMNENEAYIDEAMITGEPAPVAKRKGDRVLAGTVVKQGSLRFKAEQVGKDTMLAHIIRMVEEAQGSKAPVQRTADKIALIFVPVVLCISVATFALWFLIGGSVQLPRAILSAVSVLVIACPCAMGLATPTALMVGIGKAAQKNILIKDATALENIRSINAMVIDKTGTLTIPNENVDFTRSEELSPDERETLKPHSREAMDELRRMGIEVYMMSGDKEEAARYWAEKSGIDHWQSRALPQDKENLVRRLQSEGKRVAMVGDGINDSQALAAADVSIAMGKGTDIAMDVAQLTLMGTDLRRIPDAVRLSRKTVRMIYENLFWAFVYNIVCIPLAAGMLYFLGIDFQITPTWASALMAFSSVSVVLNSLRLKLSE